MTEMLKGHFNKRIKSFTSIELIKPSAKPEVIKDIEINSNKELFKSQN